MEIFNTKYQSKKGVSSDNYIGTYFSTHQRLLPSSDFNAVIDEAEVYKEERKNCNKYRIIITINPLCTNVLFNRISEVVYKEGSDECTCYNIATTDIGANLSNTILNTKSGNELIGKTFNAFNRTSKDVGSVTLTRDTQLSAFDEIDYKCGVDIFNNHILRSLTFKSVCPISNMNNNFNTLFDRMREWDKQQVNGFKPSNYNDVVEGMHLYLAEEVLPYDDSVDENLIEENGWLGFSNTGRLLIYDIDDKGNDKPMNINRVICNKPTCGFIDLYPSRDLWYFTPKFNKYRNRFEKNWNYCLTYPSSSTRDVSFIHKNGGLKI